jgi:hypothetical protein
MERPGICLGFGTLQEVNSGGIVFSLEFDFFYGIGGDSVLDIGYI